MTKLSYAGMFNVRDLGGFTTEDDKTTKSGVFIRSGNLDKVPATSQQQVIDYGIKTIIDLRSEWEQESYRNVFADNANVTYQNIPLIDATLLEKEEADDDQFIEIYDYYITYIDTCRSQIQQIFATLVEADGGVMFHCHAGKDRTGITSALLLSAVGVSDADIAEDYGRSRGEVDHLIEEMRAYLESQGRDTSLIERMMSAEPDTMLRTLSYIKTNYGSVEEYLKTSEVADQTINKLKVKFLE